MSKQDILTVTIVSACVIAIILLVIRLTKAAKEDAQKQTTTQQEENPAELLPEGTDSSLVDETPVETEPEDTRTDDEPQPTAAKPTEPTTTKKPATTNQPATTVSSEGKYMVLAGSFQQRANADKLVKQLKGKGYTNARVEIFDRGKYAVVLVDRFDNLDDARELQQRLKADGVDCYVKLKTTANR
ncbi:MAG: hypothetical protein Kow0027_22390 [Saprospiraceae bacterium]